MPSSKPTDRATDPAQADGIRLTGRLICSSLEEAGIIRRHLPVHLRLTRAEAGCRAFDVTPTDDPLIWTVAEHFTDAEAFAAHQRRTGASDWGRATAGIRRDYTITGLE